MEKYLKLSKEVIERIFPCIDKMIDIHIPFLEELRIRQNERPVVSSISDILHKQFSGNKQDLIIQYCGGLFHQKHCPSEEGPDVMPIS